MTELLWLPDHKCELILSHNPHRSNYQSIEEYVAANGIDDYWVSQSERDAAIETDDLWEVHWYPDTPIGFYVVGASTLEALRAYFVEEWGND